MRMDEFQSACEEVKLSKQQADKIMQRAKRGARKKCEDETRRSLPVWSYVSGLAAAALILCAVGTSVIWQNLYDQTASQDKEIAAELTEEEYSFVLYVTEYEQVIKPWRDILMIMAVSVDTEEKSLVFEPVSVDRYLDNWSDEVNTAKQLDELYEEFGPELTTKLLAETLDLISADYIVIDRLELEKFIDDCGTVRLEAMADDLLDTHRDINSWRIGVDYYDPEIQDKRRMASTVKSAGVQDMIGEDAIAWVLCTNERREYDLFRERQIELFTKIVEKSRSNINPKWMIQVLEMVSEAGDGIGKPEVLVDILTGPGEYTMNKR